VLAKTGNNETWLGCRYAKRTVQAERNIANLIEQKELAEAKLISENQLVGDFSAQLCETVRMTGKKSCALRAQDNCQKTMSSRLLNLRAANKLKVRGSQFCCKNIHK